MFSSQREPLTGWGAEEGGRAEIRRGGSLEVGATQGKSKRGSRTTSGWSWVAGRRLEEAAPRREAAGGELSRDGGALGS